MWKRSWLLALGLMLAFAFGWNLPTALAQGPAPLGGKTCVTCHSQPTFGTRMENGETLSLYVDPNSFARSIHGQRGLTCADCHSAIARTPNHPTAARCQDCHAVAGQKPASLGIVGSLPYAEADAYRRANANLSACQLCHPNQFAANRDRLHAGLEANGRAPTCTACHNPHATEPTVAPYAEVSARCVECHRQLYNEKLLRVHGHSPLTGGSDSLTNATCVECHSVHQATASTKPVVVLSAGEQQCATCHANLGARGGISLAAEVRQPNLLVLAGRVTVKVAGAHSEAALRNQVQQTCQSCHSESDLAFDGLRQGSLRPARPRPTADVWGNPSSAGLALGGILLAALYVGQDFLVAGIRKLRRQM